MKCDKCGSVDDFSPEVSAIVLDAPGLRQPYVLIPSEGYQHCTNCNAVFTLIDKAQEAHPMTRNAGLWTRALIVYVDLTGGEVTAKRMPHASA